MGNVITGIQGILVIIVIVVVIFLGYTAYNFFFGHGEGTPCTATNGTIWPFSGCNISAGLCCDGKCSKGPCTATAQGGKCNIDMDCAGWTVFGNVACCDHECITKDWSGQICDAKRAGDACTEASGTIWPFSGCDISAGMCCKSATGPGNVCSSTPCPPGGVGTTCSAANGTIWPFSGCDISAGLCCNGKCSKGPCAATPQDGTCTVDWDCAGWSLFGSVACCGGKCVTKDFSLQTCADYCAKYGC